DQVLVDLGRQVDTLRQSLEGTFQLLLVHFEPACKTTLLGQFHGVFHTQLVLGLFTHGNDVARANLVGRHVNRLAIHRDGTVGDQLTCLGAGGAKAHAVDYIVQTAFQQLQEDFAGGATGAGSLLVVTTELLFQHAIHTTYFLLFAQLNAVVGQAALTAVGRSRARRLIRLALGIQRADTALQEQVGAFTTGKLALGTDVSCHLALTPVTRGVFSAAGSRCAESVSRRKCW